MNATTVWSLADPVTIKFTGVSNEDLCQTIFPDSEVKTEILKMFKAAPAQKGSFTATVWVAAFPVRPDYLMEFFSDAKVEHEGSTFRLRCPTIQEYLEFQNRTFVKGLVGAISKHDDHFFYDDNEHEPFDIVGCLGDYVGAQKYMHKIDYDRDSVSSFLLIVENF